MLGTIIFCGLELFAHTIFGIIMYFKLKDMDKSTIYGPGSITAYLGFAVFGTILVYCLHGTVIQTIDIITEICLLGIIAIFGILLPKKILKNEQSVYSFSSEGYYKKFLKKEIITKYNL